MGVVNPDNATFPTLESFTKAIEKLRDAALFDASEPGEPCATALAETNPLVSNYFLLAIGALDQAQRFATLADLTMQRELAGEAMSVARLLKRYGFVGYNPDEWEELDHTQGPTILAVSNRAVIVADLPDTDVIDLDNDGLLVRSESTEVQEWIGALANYPVADDSDYSERETEAENEAWASYGREEFCNELTDYLNTKLATLGVDTLANEAIVETLIEDLSIEQVDTLYYHLCQTTSWNGGATCMWEENYDGSIAVFGITQCLKGWDGLVPSDRVGHEDEWCPVHPFDARICSRCDRKWYGNPLAENAWFSDCLEPECDIPAQHPNADPLLAPMALAVVRGEDYGPLADACEERGMIAYSRDLRGRHWAHDYVLTDKAATAARRKACKALIGNTTEDRIAA